MVKLAYPGWGAACAYLMIILSVICIPVFAILYKTGLYKIQPSDELDPVEMNDLVRKSEV